MSFTFNTNYRFELGGRAYVATLGIDRDTKSRTSTARAYVHATPGDDINSQLVLEPFAKMVGSDTIYTQRDKFPALDKAWDALNQFIVDEKSKVLRAAIAVMTSSSEEEAAALKGFKFSRKAGCACGCSPGFVMPGLPNRSHLFVDADTKAQAVAS